MFPLMCVRAMGSSEHVDFCVWSLTWLEQNGIPPSSHSVCSFCSCDHTLNSCSKFLYSEVSSALEYYVCFPL